MLLEKLQSIEAAEAGEKHLPKRTVSLPILHQRQDYPRVTIWTAEEWAKHPQNKKFDDTSIHQSAPRRGKNRDQGATRKSTYYIQDVDGVSPTERQANAITDYARTVWESLAQQKMAPVTWKKRTAPAFMYYLEEMYKFHDDLRLCEGHWKAEKLAVEVYPGWSRNRTDLVGERIKEEAAEVGIDANSRNKRKRPPTPTTSIKPEKQPKLEPTPPGPNIPPSTSLASVPLPQISLITPDLATPSGDVPQAPVQLPNILLTNTGQPPGTQGVLSSVNNQGGLKINGSDSPTTVIQQTTVEDQQFDNTDIGVSSNDGVQPQAFQPPGDHPPSSEKTSITSSIVDANGNPELPKFKVSLAQCSVGVY